MPIQALNIYATHTLPYQIFRDGEMREDLFLAQSISVTVKNGTVIPTGPALAIHTRNAQPDGQEQYKICEHVSACVA